MFYCDFLRINENKKHRKSVFFTHYLSHPPPLLLRRRLRMDAVKLRMDKQ